MCHNCHCELHDDLIKLPTEYNSFDENYAEYNNVSKLTEVELSYIRTNPCAICGELTYNHNITCSRSCAAKRQYSADWDSIDLRLELETKTYKQIGKELGVSDGAVHKRAKKLGLK